MRCGLLATSWLASSRYPAAYTASSGEPVEPTARGSGRPRVARKTRRKLAVWRFSRENRLQFLKDQRPGKQRKEEQNDQDGPGHPSGLLDQIAQFARV